MRFFPVFSNIENETVLLIGNGHHAYEKIEKLLPYGANIRLFAEQGFDELASIPQITLERRKFSEEDLDPIPVFVIAADLDHGEASWISDLCRQRNIPFNAVDVPELCTFYFPALITKGAFTLAISTSGKSPAAAALLRQRIEPEIPDKIDEILDWSDGLRRELKLTTPDAKIRRHILRRAVSAAMEYNRPLTQVELDSLLSDSN